MTGRMIRSQGIDRSWGGYFSRPKHRESHPPAISESGDSLK
jgi:hypothetical protein